MSGIVTQLYRSPCSPPVYNLPSPMGLGVVERQGTCIGNKNLGQGGSPGLVMMGRDSRSEGCGFKTQHCILDGHFFTFIGCKNFNVCLKSPKINKKRPGLANLKKTLESQAVRAIQQGLKWVWLSWQSGRFQIQRDPWFESRHRGILLPLECIERTKIKKKRSIMVNLLENQSWNQS